VSGISLLNVHTHQISPRRVVQPNVEILTIALHHDQLPPPRQDQWLSVGWHPWCLPEGVGFKDALLEVAQRPDVMAIGECGLDTVCTTPWSLQLAAFEASLEVAAEVQKPVILHIVRAYDTLWSIRKSHQLAYPNHCKGWVIHGFDKHPQLAQTCVDAGMYLSFGAALLRTGSHASQALQQIPLERVLMETDAQTHTTLMEIYERAATLLGLNLEALAAQIHQNWQAVQSG
jgi:TatD DNase family protein